MAEPCDLLVTNAGELCTLAGAAPRRGRSQAEVAAVTDGAVAVREGRVLFAGPRREVERAYRGDRVLDAGGLCVTPGLVDAHTHLVWAGSREDEFAQRVAGRPYREIAQAGGGIRATVRATRAADEEALVAAARRRLGRMLDHGTTTAEVKSGYGLDTETELRQLRVVRRLAREQPVDLVPTFLGAHEFPDEYRDDREGYVRLLVEEMVPAVREAGLAEFCDAFCEEGVFDPAQTARVLEAAAAQGLAPKLHADELSPTGGAELAARLGAASADHLVATGPEGIRALARRGVVAVLLPGTSYHLGTGRYAPARAMVEAGVPVALATDCNPGSCTTESMTMVLSLACLGLRLGPSEALVAATINAACAIRREAEVGSLEPGKRADLVVWEAPNHRYLAYHFGVNLARTVIQRGVVVRGPAT
ncbi:MAG: imidazolonepropionase [Planctomycetes bacterium]|nr:imidazolonepropionase [Planctomycetota bacterium]